MNFRYAFLDELEKLAEDPSVEEKGAFKQIPKKNPVGRQWRSELAAKLSASRGIDPLMARKRILPAMRKDIMAAFRK